MSEIEIASRKAAVADILKTKPNISGRAAAKELGISETAFRRYKKMVLQEQTNVLTRLQESRYKKAYDELKKERDALVDDLDIAKAELNTYASIPGIPEVIDIPAPKRGRSEVCPVIVASDWHIEETVTSDITNGHNEYNLDIAKDSVKQFFSKACDLVNQAKSRSKVSTVVLAILGDIINGVLRAEDLESNQTTSIDAITIARSLLYSGIKELAKSTECKIAVVCCVGNHGRLTDKIYFSNQVKHSLEYLLYTTLERDFRDHPTVRFKVSKSPYAILDILGLRVRFQHGHSIKFHGGIGGIAVPIMRKVAQFNTIDKADLDVIGHFHTSQVLSNVIVNGSLVGSNGFSMSLGLPHEIPKQIYFEIDSKYGRTLVAPICIDRKVNHQDKPLEI